MSDLIDRQAAIDALNEYFVRIGKLKRRGLNKGEKAIGLDTVGVINSLSPAQPEPCEDAVSRKAVLDAIDGWKWACANSGHKQTESDIKLIRKEFIELPPVTPKQHWIPVTERLPEEDDYRPCYGYEDGAVWWRNDMGLMGLGWYYPSYGKWAYYDESDRCDKCVGNVVEWMPLPKP